MELQNFGGFHSPSAHPPPAGGVRIFPAGPAVKQQVKVWPIFFILFHYFLVVLFFFFIYQTLDPFCCFIWFFIFPHFEILILARFSSVDNTTQLVHAADHRSTNLLRNSKLWRARLSFLPATTPLLLSPPLKNWWGRASLITKCSTIWLRR